MCVAVAFFTYCTETTGRTDGQRTDDDDGRTWTDGQRTDDDVWTDNGTNGRTEEDDNDDGKRWDTTERTERGYSFIYNYKFSNRTLGPNFQRHNKSTLYRAFSTPTVKSHRIGYTRPQGLASEEFYNAKAATSNFKK